MTKFISTMIYFNLFFCTWPIRSGNFKACLTDTVWSLLEAVLMYQQSLTNEKLEVVKCLFSWRTHTNPAIHTKQKQIWHCWYNNTVSSQNTRLWWGQEVDKRAKEWNRVSDIIQGSKLRPIQSHLRHNFFPLRLKYLEKSQICDIFSTLLFWNRRVSSYHSAATFTEINKEIKLLFLAMNFLSI